MPPLIKIQNSTLWNNRLKNSPHYSKSNKWTTSLSLILDRQIQITNQDRTWLDSVHTAEEMDTLSCIAEPKLSMIRLKDNRHEITKSATQSSLMITINEEYRTLGLRIIKISVSNPDTEIRTTRHPIDKLVSTQIGTETQTQIDNITRTDQATPGTTDQITVSRLSITSMLDQRPLISVQQKLSTEQQSAYAQLSSIHRWPSHQHDKWSFFLQTAWTENVPFITIWRQLCFALLQILSTRPWRTKP